MGTNYEIFINGVNKPNIVWSDSVQREYDYRRSYDLSGKFTFLRRDAHEIINDPIDREYAVIITNDAGTWFTGTFRKIDCEIDEADLSVTVSFKRDDDYTIIQDNINKEFDLIKDIKCPQTAISYDNKTLLQIYIRHSRRFSNVIEGFSYEEENESDLAAFVSSGFEYVGQRFVVSGDTVSGADGIYDENGVKGTYSIHLAYAPGGIINEIEVRDGGVTIFQTAFVGNPFGDGLNSQGLSLTGASTLADTNVGFDGRSARLYDANFDYYNLDPFNIPASVRVYAYPVYARILTENTAFNGVPTVALDQDTDVTGATYSYKLGYNTALLAGFPLDFGFVHVTAGGDEVVPASSLNGAGLLYEELGTKIYASQWRENSVYYDDSLDLSSGDTSFTLNHAYSYYNIIKYWLLWKGSTIIPVVPYDLYLTPSTNITIGKYDIAAKKGKTTLKAIMDSLMHCFKLDYHIQGGLLLFNTEEYYDDLPVGLDLTSAIEPKTGRSWGYRSKKYTYNKDAIPERIEFKFSNTSSELFNGRPIVHKSSFVDQEKKVNINVPYFTDLQWAILNGSDVSSDSLIMLYGNGASRVAYRELNGRQVQNGDLSWTHIHPTFYKDVAACELLEINDEEVMADSVKKNKIQKISVPLDNFNPLVSILTDLGTGKIIKIRENMVSGIAEIELHHDI